MVGYAMLNIEIWPSVQKLVTYTVNGAQLVHVRGRGAGFAEAGPFLGSHGSRSKLEAKWLRIVRHSQNWSPGIVVPTTYPGDQFWMSWCLLNGGAQKL